jgi:protein O-GlcNAc transferase
MSRKKKGRVLGRKPKKRVGGGRPRVRAPRRGTAPAAISGVAGDGNCAVAVPRSGDSSREVAPLLESAVRHHRQGHFDRARAQYRRILEMRPDHPDALHLLGLTEHQQGESAKGAELIRKAIERSPANALYHFNLGVALRQSGDIEGAFSAYEKALELKPDYPDPFFNIGNLYREKGDHDRAVACYEKVLATKPDDIRVLYNYGNVRKEQGRFDEAIEIYRRILSLNSEEAQAHYNIGAVLQLDGKPEAAYEHYRKALELEPGNARAHNNIGNIFQSLGRQREAIDCYRKAVELNGNYSIAHFNLGNVHQAMDEMEEAIDCYRKAVDLEFDDPNALVNMALAMRGRGRMLEAADALRQAVDASPDHYRATSSLVHHLQYMCEWDPLAKLAPRLDEMTRQALEKGEDIAESPFENVTRHPDPARNLAIAGRWAANIEKAITSLPEAGIRETFRFEERRRKPADKLVVGYLSHDFCNHPVAHLMLSLFQLHDRNRFAIHAYSYGKDDGSPYRKLIRKRADKFVDIREMGHIDAARRIHEDGVDILIDLMGYTKHNRLGICALRPAPVQATYLGYPGTTGAKFIDYLISDRIVTPPEHAPYYSERLVRLPHTYIVTDGAQPVATPPSRSEAGLPEDAFVFCSFNQPYKIEPVLFDIWMNLLRQIPDSVLWMPRRYDPVPDNLRREARKRGVDGDRIVFAGKVPAKSGHLARLSLADLGLDPRIYNGHATTLDTLWAGVPVVTRIGGHFASRAAASFLDAVGLPELIANDAAEYEALALRLAREPEDLAELRKKLAGNLRTFPLFDTPRFARNLEAAFERMWDVFRRGESPRPLDIPDVREGRAYLDIEFSLEDDSGALYAQSAARLLDGAVAVRVNTASDAPAEHADRFFAAAAQHHNAGMAEKAETLCRKALRLSPDHPEAHHLLGILSYRAGRFDEALAGIRKAIDLKPSAADFHSNLGVVLQRMGRVEEAVENFRKATALNPEFPDPYNNMGPALKALGRNEEALESYRKALELRPGYPEAYNNMGNTLQAMGRTGEAVESFRKALEIKPEYAEAHYNMGNALQNLGRLEEAIAAFERSLEINPDYEKAFAILFYRLKYVCAWEKIEAMRPRLEEMTAASLRRGEKPAETPFVNLTTYDDPERNFRVARAWSRSIEQAAAGPDGTPPPPFDFSSRKSRTGKIVVGYLSNDFYDHPVAHQMLSLFSLHDRNRFEIRCYSHGKDDGSVYRREIRNRCDAFVDIQSSSHLESARRIYADGVDILVDLMGHTKDNRLDICARRPAPIMVTYLGFPGTTGARFFDYIVTDRIATPDSVLRWYSEQPVWMPHSYMVNDHLQAIADHSFRRGELGLPEEGVVFVSFNQTYKVEPIMFDLWMRILRRVPGSVLWLSHRGPAAERNLKAETERRGVDGARLVFAPKMLSKSHHLARLQMADLALDTRIYNGHATTNDALWAGVPVIALTGNHFASRASASFLHAVGMPELIADTAEEYEELAVRLARDPAERRAVRDRLNRNRFTEPLFDTPRFVRNLESAFEALWERYRAGEAPSPLDVADRGPETRSPIRSPAADPAPDAKRLFEEAVACHRAGRLDEAEAAYAELLTRNPRNPDALHLSGVVAHQKGDHRAAIDAIRRALELSPRDKSKAPFLNNLGSAQQAMGRLREAVESYREAIALSPDFAEAHFNLALVRKLLGEKTEALAGFKRAARLKPNNHEAFFNIGILLHEKGRHDFALSFYQQALRLKPDYDKAYNNLGTLYQELGRYHQAIFFHKKAVAVMPRYAEAHFNMGNAYKGLNRLKEAVECYRKAIELKPERPEFYIGMGNIHKSLDRMDEAAACYRKSLELRPDYPEATGSLFHCLQNICAWEDIGPLARKLDEMNRRAIAAGERTPEVPFVNLTRTTDPEANLAVARAWSLWSENAVRDKRIPFSFDDRKHRSGKITVGYLSHDFCNHPVGHLMQGLFGLHDRNRFNVFVYSYGPDDGSSYRRRIRESCDRFVDLSATGHADAARRIAADKVDILVDLMGHTKGKRMEICALRPAPVLVTYLGFPGSTGADFFDYLIADRIVVPEGMTRFYTEKLVYLPDTYMVTDHRQTISDRKWAKSDLGLEEDAFLFCSLNKAYKIEPAMFDVWMRILSRTPGSHLWLRQVSAEGERNLRKEAGRRGVAPERLVFSGKVPDKADYLARLRLVDLALDTRIYNGHATTCDALWAGVPVITCKGSHFASRAASSLLRAVGMEALVVEDLRSYEESAAELARDRDRLAALRRTLARNRETRPLFDTPRFVRNLEAAFSGMWKRWTEGKPPASFDVAGPESGVGDMAVETEKVAHWN